MSIAPILDLKLTWGNHPEGERFTSATYRDLDGSPRSTRINGHLSDPEVRHSIMYHRRRTTAWAS